MSPFRGQSLVEGIRAYQKARSSGDDVGAQHALADLRGLFSSARRIDEGDLVWVRYRDADPASRGHLGQVGFIDRERMSVMVRDERPITPDVITDGAWDRRVWVTEADIEEVRPEELEGLIRIEVLESTELRRMFVGPAVETDELDIGIVLSLKDGTGASAVGRVIGNYRGRRRVALIDGTLGEIVGSRERGQGPGSAEGVTQHGYAASGGSTGAFSCDTTLGRVEGITHKGLKELKAGRPKPNEDGILFLAQEGGPGSQPFVLAAVADGLGGSRDGQGASAVLLDVFLRVFVDNAGAGIEGEGLDPDNVARVLRGAIALADGRIRKETPQSGTAFSAAVLFGSGYLALTRIADCRYALRRQGKTICVSRDQSRLQARIESGELLADVVYDRTESPRGAIGHPQSSGVLSSVGEGVSDSDIEVETIDTVSLAEGPDTKLDLWLHSDGLDDVNDLPRSDYMSHEETYSALENAMREGRSLEDLLCPESIASAGGTGADNLGVIHISWNPSQL